MKIFLLKYICLPIICLTSIYSYVFLNDKAAFLTEDMANRPQPKEKRVVIRNPKNNSTQVVYIAPPKDSTKEEKDKKDYVEEDKNMLPDVEFLKFIIDKGKEGIPVLKFNGFFACSS